MSLKNLFISILIQTLILCYFSQNSYAGPFGTNMGDKPEQFEGLTLITSNTKEQTYKANKLPKNHSYLASYELTFRKSGLAQIIGASSPYEDGYCNETRKIYDTIKSQLSNKYHNPDDINEFDMSVKDMGERFFCYTLYENKRKHFCKWTKNLPNDIKEIMLGIAATSKDTSAVLIMIKYKNIDEEYKVIDNKSDSDAL